VILYRCFAWNERAQHTEPDGALWFPRVFQGEGRHDNPDVYGCLYLADRAVSPVVEQLARFRGQRLGPAMLRRRGLPLALADLELDPGAELIDLDDPIVLGAERLRPSRVATRRRDVTQPQARLLYERHVRAVGLRWWSSYEALWINVTLFDRGAGALRVRSVRSLAMDDSTVIEASQIFGFQVR
jgi:hypothetical protein